MSLFTSAKEKLQLLADDNPHQGQVKADEAIGEP